VLKHKTTYHFYFKALLVALCPVFFAVQLFFNFELPGDSGVQENNTFGFLRIANKTQQVRTRKEPPAHHGFRLNKHFQPESLPSSNILIPVPVEHIARLKKPASADYFIPSALLQAQTLRGPPRT